VPGRANRIKPTAVITGPIIRGTLGPKRGTSPPAHVLRRKVSTINGRKALPAAVAE
jgi:hypothetical protein